MLRSALNAFCDNYEQTPNTTDYVVRTRFTVPHGIAAIATGSNAWATGGNLLGWVDYVHLKYVECSFTYIANTTGFPVTQTGWYFWYGYLSGSTKVYENYIKLTFDPTAHDMEISLYQQNGGWWASYYDITTSNILAYQIPNVPFTTIDGTQNPMIFMENVNGNCTNYSQFDSLHFTKFKYLDRWTSETSQNPTVWGYFSGGLSCVVVDQSTLTVRHS